MSYKQTARFRFFFAILMIVGSVARLADGHVSTFTAVLYGLVVGLGLLIIAQTVVQPRWRK